MRKVKVITVCVTTVRQIVYASFKANFSSASFPSQDASGLDNLKGVVLVIFWDFRGFVRFDK